MTLDKDTLTKAEKARDALLELQHSAEVARVDYHHAIRQLHAAGGSLREIADALGLSHQRVHQIVEPVDGSSGHRGGPPAHRLHRRMRAFMPFERFTADARDIVARALDEAAELGHRRIGTEHLLIGLATKPSSVEPALTGLGATRDAVVAAVVERLGSGPAGTHGRRPFTPAARRVLERAVREGKMAREKELRADHILLGIVADGGDAAEILTGLGATAEKVRSALAPSDA